MRSSQFRVHTLLILATYWAVAEQPAIADENQAVSIRQRTEGLDTRAGFLVFHLDHDHGKVWLETPAPDPQTGHILDCIYVESLRGGLGSNPVGLDRGQLGPSRLISLRDVGGKLLVEQQNVVFRAVSESADEHGAVRDSFATSVLWAGPFETPSGGVRKERCTPPRIVSMSLTSRPRSQPADTDGRATQNTVRSVTPVRKARRM